MTAVYARFIDPPNTISGFKPYPHLIRYGVIQDVRVVDVAIETFDISLAFLMNNMCDASCKLNRFSTIMMFSQGLRGVTFLTF